MKRKLTDKEVVSLRMNQAQVDFQQLRIKHILFKSKVRSALYGGTYDADFFSSSGPISTWFNLIGSKYRHMPQMHELIKIQQELDSTANLLLNRYKSGKIEQAHEGLVKVDELSERFIQTLSSLEKKLVV